MTKRKPGANGRTLRRLRARLREAEDTLRAIRDGHVDALIVDSPEGDQLYPLRSADQPYRLMVEQMREGALTLSADGTILYCNARFAQLVGRPSAEIVGEAFATFVAPDDREKLQAMLDAPTFRDECEVVTAQRTSFPAQLSASALVIDGTRTTALVISDLTPERREKAL